MAKFKNMKFDFYTMIIFPKSGRFILGGTTFECRKELDLLFKDTIDYLGWHNEEHLPIAIPEKTFRYLARQMHPGVDGLPLIKESIIIYKDPYV